MLLDSPVTFLTPIPALIAAAVVVPALLALYFLRLRRRPVRVSSTLLWGAQTRDLQVNVPFRWLRPSWLLFLQLLILALFLLALARPAIDIGASTPERVVLVIDRTASMSATDAPDGRTRLEEARAAATRFIDGALRAGGGTEVCLVEFAHEARATTGFLRDRAALKAAVRAIEPTDHPGGPVPALRLAGALLAADATEGEESPRAPPGLVVLFSDGSFAGSEPLTLSGAEFRFERAGPPEAEAAGRDNLGIVAIAARREYEDPGAVRVFARVQNAGASPASAALALSLDGGVIERRAVTVPGAPPGEARGQVGVTFEVRTGGSGVVVVTIAREDHLESDNGAAVVLAPAARPRIILVIPDPPAQPGEATEPPPEGPEWLLSDPLRELHARSFRIIPASAYEQAAASESGVSADLVIFDRVRPSRLPPVPTLSFGAGLPLPGADLAPGSGAGTDVLAWDRSSPVLRNVSLDSVFVAQPMRVVDPGPEPRAGGVPDRSGSRSGAPVEIAELARGRDGPLILRVQDGATRRLVVAFELAQSTWPVDFGFAIFLADAVDYLTLRGEDQVSGGGATFTTAQPAEILAESGGGAGASEAVLRGPVEVRVRLPEGAGGLGAPRRVGVGVLERAGVYRVEAGGEARSIAVNLLDETESALLTRDALRVSGEAVAAGVGGRGPREIWEWFVLAALLLLALEWFLHAWLMRV